MIKKKPAESVVPKRAAKSAARPVSKSVTRAASGATAAPGKKVATAPAAKVQRVARPAAKSTVKPAVKPTPKAAGKVTGKTAVKPIASRPQAAGAAATAPADGVSAGSLLDTRDRPRKPKLVRDSFTMPEAEYAALGEVKKACLKAGYEVKKSELLRVGVGLIRKLDIVTLKDILAALPPLKAGRPKKS